MSDGKVDKIIAYDEPSDIIEQQHEAKLHQHDSASWAFKDFTKHQGPIKPSDKCYKDGLETFKPLSVMVNVNSKE
jgi:hypothetical protein